MMGKPYQKWSDVKAELMKDADFSEEWLASKPFRQVASEVARIRCEKGLTQRELAKLVGTSYSAISRIESLNYGKVSLTTLVRIAEALGVELQISFKEAS